MRRVVCILCIVLLTVSPLYANPFSFEVSQVKAVFLYNLTNFVSWPDKSFESQKSPFKICVLGDDSLGLILEKSLNESCVDGGMNQIRTFVIGGKH